MLILVALSEITGETITSQGHMRNLQPICRLNDKIKSPNALHDHKLQSFRCSVRPVPLKIKRK